MMLALASAKGAPGVTSSGLVLAAGWPRPVVLVEADPSGGDLALRCRSTADGPIEPAPNLLGLAATARSNTSGRMAELAQELACGVRLVQGVTSPAQGRGLGALWPAIADLLAAADVDVIADLGRLDATAAHLPVATASDQLLLVCGASVDSVHHLRTLVSDLVDHRTVGVLASRIRPLLIGAARHGEADRRDVDELMAATQIPVAACAHLPLDHPALLGLEDGGGRGLSRSLLLRSARGLADQLAGTTEQAPA